MKIDDVGRGTAVAKGHAGVADTSGHNEFASTLQQALNRTGERVAQQQDGAVEHPEQAKRSAVEEFMAWVQMTPAEKMRDRILKELGLTEEQLAEMDLEERAKIEELIAQKVREELELQAQQALREG